MTWLKKDDRFPEHRKIRRLSDAAYRLHDTAMCYAAKDESDGFLDEADIEEMQHGRRLRRSIPALVDAGLWEVVEGGWLIHDFLDYNLSHAKQEAKRAADRERQERLRRQRVEAISHGVSRERVASESQRESQHPVPSRPDPSRPDPTRPVVGVLRVVADGDSSPNRHLGDGPRSATFGLEGDR